MLFDSDDWGTTHNRGQVTPESHPSGVPTDPDVRNSRIRLLESPICCSIRCADTSRLREHIALHQLTHDIPASPTLRAT